MPACPELRETFRFHGYVGVDEAGLEAAARAAGWRLRSTQDDERVLHATSRGEPCVALLDLRGLDEVGLQALRRRPALAEALAARQVAWVAILEAGQLALQPLRRLVRECCHDYVTWPCERELLATVLGHAHGMASLAVDGKEGAASTPAIEGMVGDSAGVRRLAGRLLRAAASDAPVFLSGETGTGKELAAAAIHRQSTRSRMPFVGINCGAIPQSLIQSELFGYERGAFTGAAQRKLGRVEMAHRGTLFLDEVADLPMESQASLLRFLEQGTIERLGGTSPIEVDARIVSATHVDLEQAVDEGRFRVDLYHRLRVIELRIPPLRERIGDIELIARHALRLHAREGRFRFKGFTPGALRALQSHPWPGNVRELINRVREAMVMADGCYISARDLGLEDLPDDGHGSLSLDLARREGERAAIERALARTGYRLAMAADELGISRVTLYRLLRRHGLHDAGGESIDRRLALVKVR
ncbi:sigma-54 dependent transcriptional regulator [Luteimonas saliphila]|uniref:sigma-54 dependent transcriptional regulator n=1 Tax=Luteimonas saliphila TaxID=2804919 RepID=UPI00192D2246|nr:sigma-54 dependent transcriptional regulator [Luteimonas saliphila]